jgi:two-component system OmpR family response regulator
MSGILLIEDEQNLVEALTRGLKAEGYLVQSRNNGREGFTCARENQFDLILLDVLLPEMNGFEICEGLRKLGNSTPIMMLTAQSDDLDIAEGLDLGADDYLIKPFAFVVLLSRIRSLIRRSTKSESDQSIVAGRFSIDSDSHRVFFNSHEIHLTAKEFLILHYFLVHPRRVISKRELLDQLWDMNYDGDLNIVEVYIRRLRMKLDVKTDTPVIETVRGVGYRVNLDVE